MSEQYTPIQGSQPGSAYTAANGQKKPRKKRIEDRRFPYNMNFNVTAKQYEAVKRMCRGPFKQSQVGQLALHEFLIARDPTYADTWGDE